MNFARDMPLAPYLDFGRELCREAGTMLVAARRSGDLLVDMKPGFELVTDLDRAIDAWPDGERGFHAIEAKLFGAHDVQVLPATLQLINNLTEFEHQLRATTLTAQGLLNGTAKLIYEIGENKAEGGESPFSGNSLTEMRVNVVSVAAAYQRVFAPLMKKRDADLARVFAKDLAVMQALVSVPTSQDLDQVRLRDASESLVNDLAIVGKEAGLEKPRLGN